MESVRADGGDDRRGDALSIVGVGASAGGLDALTELIENLKLDGIALVIVQHLAPDQESHLATLLGRVGTLKVSTAEEGMRVQAGHAYVIPPNADLAMEDGALHLIRPRRDGAHRLPIDFFFRSLAQDLGARSAGVILSGTGTDGTFGLQAIKAAGGVTFVQDPQTARYDGMPTSALDSGHADFCLPPNRIGQELVHLLSQGAAGHEDVAALDDKLGRLFVLIRTEFGHDLTHYKPSTVQRRIERRMMFLRIDRLEDYIERAETDLGELRALFDDLLINVTSFFRDHEPFEVLKTRIMPTLLGHKDASAPIRAWIPACASGEEAYSVAICLIEALEEVGRDNPVQVFGTDIDIDAIARARRGIYPANIALDVSSERLARFFVKRHDQYQISRRIRDLAVFSVQNMIKDPPFSRIDLVSCRNLLIYLRPPAQKKALRVVHYALNPFGFLLLGSSESVGDAPELFSLLDRKNKLYAKKNQAVTPPLELGRTPETAGGRAPAPPAAPASTLERLVDLKILEMYGTAGVVINEQLDILQFRGHIGRYLGPSPGVASLNVLRLARPDLHAVLVTNIRNALQEDLPVSAEVASQDPDSPGAVRVDIVPLRDPVSSSRCLLVLFRAAPQESPLPVVADDADGGDATRPFARRIRELERELAVTRDYLQTLTEERESASEELRAANEELQCANEELQSTNEELETSKEEMQSANEELTTVNDELHHRMGQLNQAHDDLLNVLSGVDHAVLIVDMGRRIRRYTAAAEKLFNLVPGDVGRSIDYIDRFLGSAQAGNKVSTVIDTLATMEEEMLCSNRRWYLLRISPYRTADHVIRGAVLSLSDIDVQRRASQLTRNVGDYAERFLGAIGHPLVIVDDRLRIIWANERYFEASQLSAEETIGSVFHAADARDGSVDLRERLLAALSSGAPFRDLRVDGLLGDRGQRTVSLGAGRLPLPDTHLLLISIETVPTGREVGT